MLSTQLSEIKAAGRWTEAQAEQTTPCFTLGTMIATARGEVAVEGLNLGDSIITRDSGIQQVRWIGRRHFTARQFIKASHLRPILIRKGALGRGQPERDMKVSPNHRMLVEKDKTALLYHDPEVLVAAKHLVGLDGVEEIHGQDVTYIHLMFDHHEVILSDGAWSESFQPDDRSLSGIGNAQRQEILEIFPALATPAGREAFEPARRTLSEEEADLLVK